jgi:hypothetical protein
MEWIFVDLGVGSLGLLAAQLLDYIVESKRVRRGNMHLRAFTSDVPPRDALPATEISAWYDEAA